MSLRAFGWLNGDRFRLCFANDIQFEFRLAGLLHCLDELSHGSNFFAVGFDDNVVLFQAGFLRRATLKRVDHQ